jgi:hypothetical protein
VMHNGGIPSALESGMRTAHLSGGIEIPLHFSPTIP